MSVNYDLIEIGNPQEIYRARASACYARLAGYYAEYRNSGKSLDNLRVKTYISKDDIARHDEIYSGKLSLTREEVLVYTKVLLGHKVFKKYYGASIYIDDVGTIIVTTECKYSYKYSMVYLMLVRYLMEEHQKIRDWYKAYSAGIDPLQAMILAEDYTQSQVHSSNHCLMYRRNYSAVPFKNWSRLIHCRFKNDLKSGVLEGFDIVYGLHWGIDEDLIQAIRLNMENENYGEVKELLSSAVFDNYTNVEYKGDKKIR